MQEHQRTEETYKETLILANARNKEKLSRLMRKAELDMETVIKARDAVWAALPYRFKQEEQIRQEASNLVGELFAGSFTDGKIYSADVIKLLADPIEADAWVRRRKKLPDCFFLTEGAQMRRIVGKQYTELLFGQENEG